MANKTEFLTQNYYNVPLSDPLGQQAEFDMFFTVQEILNDSLGATMCTGTGWVARRDAIESIGGWPLAYTGEDYMLSALLTGHGWEVAFVREPMQVGSAPESLKALLEQRLRWVRENLLFDTFSCYLIWQCWDSIPLESHVFSFFFALTRACKN